jgi:uncharacterized protein YcfJ
MAPFCGTPRQSAVAAVAGGLLGGAAGAALGLDVVGVAVLAGLLGGLTDLGVHVVRRDAQFRAAIEQVRRRTASGE